MHPIRSVLFKLYGNPLFKFIQPKEVCCLAVCRPTSFTCRPQWQINFKVYINLSTVKQICFVESDTIVFDGTMLACFVKNLNTAWVEFKTQISSQIKVVVFFLILFIYSSISKSFSFAAGFLTSIYYKVISIWMQINMS